MIVLYPGSFNPIHMGHIRLAEYMLTQTNVEDVWLLVSPNNPLKAADTLWDEQLRLELVRAAIRGKAGLVASDFEFGLPRPSYTAHTLRALAETYPDREFALLIGEDNMQMFDRWREHEWIAENYLIYVYPRAPHPPKGGVQYAGISSWKNMKRDTPFRGIGGFYALDDAPLCAISSTQIRERLAEVRGDMEVDFEEDEILRWVPEGIRARVGVKG